MTYVLMAIGAAAGVYFILGTLFAHALRARRFSRRASVPFQDIYQAHFHELSANAAKQVWDAAASKLRISPDRLRHSDRFDKEVSHLLPVFPFTDLNDEFYWWTVDEMKRLKIDNATFESCETLGEYVSAFASKDPDQRVV